MCNCNCHKIIGQGGFDTGYRNDDNCDTCCFTRYDYFGAPGLAGSIRIQKKKEEIFKNRKSEEIFKNKNDEDLNLENNKSKL